MLTQTCTTAVKWKGLNLCSGWIVRLFGYHLEYTIILWIYNYGKEWCFCRKIILCTCYTLNWEGLEVVDAECERVQILFALLLPLVLIKNSLILHWIINILKPAIDMKLPLPAVTVKRLCPVSIFRLFEPKLL